MIERVGLMGEGEGVGASGVEGGVGVGRRGRRRCGGANDREECGASEGEREG